MACLYATSIGLPDPDSPCGLNPGGCRCPPLIRSTKIIRENEVVRFTALELSDEAKQGLSVDGARLEAPAPLPVARAIELPPARVAPRSTRAKSWLCRLGLHKDRMVHYAGAIPCGYTPCSRCGV